MSQKALQLPPITKETSLEIRLLKNFSDVCINKCIQSQAIEDDLTKDEKLCLGKCIDRAHDYLRIVNNVKSF